MTNDDEGSITSSQETWVMNKPKSFLLVVLEHFGVSTVFLIERTKAMFQRGKVMLAKHSTLDYYIEVC